MKSNNWTKWLIQTAEKWSDLAPIIRNTGVKVIDSDHQQLVKYTLELNALIKELSSQKFNVNHMNRQHIILTDIYEYAKYHFAHEEKLMREYQIKDPIQHEKHTEILNMLKNFINEFDEGKLTTSFQLKLSITEWVIEHVNNIDCKTFSLENFRHVLVKARTWKDISYIIKKTNIPDIDREHRELVECTLKINSVLDSKAKDSEKVKVARENLDELKEIITNHFTDEEKTGEKYRLPYQKIQKEQHSVFMALLDEQINKNDKELLNSLQNFKNMTIEWWINHINQLDYATLSIFLRMGAIIATSESIKDIKWMMKKTKNKKIDAEHLAIFKKIEALEKYRGSGEGDSEELKNEKIKCFSELIEMCRQHARLEEEIMIEKKVERLPIHRMDHEEMIATFERLLNEYKSGISILSQHLINKLVNIWLTHINKADIEVFGDYEND